MSDNREVKQSVSRLLGPAEPEVGCDECFAALDQYVELELSGADPDAALPGLPRGAREPARFRRRRASSSALIELLATSSE